MDTLKLTFHTWLMVVGALGTVVFGLFVDWSTFKAFGVEVTSGNAFDWTLGMLGASGAAALLMGLLLLTGPDEAGVDLGRGAGLWLSAVSTLFTLAGALSAFVAGDGKVSDLTDTTKLTGAFRRRTAK